MLLSFYSFSVRNFNVREKVNPSGIGCHSNSGISIKMIIGAMAAAAICASARTISSH